MLTNRARRVNPADRVLWGILTLQAVLLFSHPAHLPVWGDELFTLRVARLGWAELLHTVAADIHPPLYYALAKLWGMITPPGFDPAVWLRLPSGIFVLLATAVLHLVWLRHWPAQRRAWALLFWALSPAMLLFGRMARSYTLQTLAVLVAVWCLREWLRRGGGTRLALSAVSTAVVLWVHYVPGLAIAVSFLLWRGWRSRGAALWASLVAVLYLPWLSVAARALTQWLSEGRQFSGRYLLTGNPVLEYGLKATSAGVSLLGGESLPWWAFWTIPLAAWLAFRGLNRVRTGGILGPATAIGFLGASRWVSYVFMGPRLLWFAPFLTMAIASKRSRWHPLLALAWVLAMVSYWQYAHFLNLTYVAPLREIAATVEEGDAVLSERFNSDVDGLAYALGGRAEIREFGQTDLNAVGARRRIMIIRNSRDLSPHQWVSAEEAALCKDREQRVRGYLPLEWWQRLVLRNVTGSEAPETFYQVTICGQRELAKEGAISEPGRP